MRIICLTAIVFFLLSLTCLAEELSVIQDNAVSGETVQAEIIYSLFDTKKLSLLDSADNKVVVSYFAVELEDKDFAYFNLPSSLPAGTYRLQLKDRVLVGGEPADILLEDSFEVIEGESAFAIKPAIIKPAISMTFSQQQVN